jgi:hypothetical protein
MFYYSPLRYTVRLFAIMRSKTLESQLNKETGLYEHGLVLSPFLKMGITLADFQLCGKVPIVKYQ